MQLIDIISSTSIPIGYRISFLTNFWREPLLKRMEKKYRIIRPELTVLICLSFRDGLHARDICEITEQPSNTVSRAVTSLEMSGRIMRRHDPDDNRRIILSLTSAGRTLHDSIMAEFAQAEEGLLAALSEEEVSELTNLLDKLARDVGTWSRSPLYLSAFDVDKDSDASPSL